MKCGGSPETAHAGFGGVCGTNEGGRPGYEMCQGHGVLGHIVRNGDPIAQRLAH
jgi:hypothetical protein